jgi:hypothetical protein
LVLPDLIWEFWQTGTIQQPLQIPLAGPVAIYALVLGLGGIGTLRLARRVRSARSR